MLLWEMFQLSAMSLLLWEMFQCFNVIVTMRNVSVSVMSLLLWEMFQCFNVIVTMRNVSLITHLLFSVDIRTLQSIFLVIYNECSCVPMNVRVFVALLFPRISWWHSWEIIQISLLILLNFCIFQDIVFFTLCRIVSCAYHIICAILMENCYILFILILFFLLVNSVSCHIISESLYILYINVVFVTGLIVSRVILFLRVYIFFILMLFLLLVNSVSCHIISESLYIFYINVVFYMFVCVSCVKVTETLKQIEYRN